MKIVRKISAMLLSMCLLAGMCSNIVYAASASVKVTSASGNVGQTVTITCTASLSGADIGGADVTLQYDPAAISVVSCSSGASGGSGSVYYSAAANNAGTNSLSFTVTFEILKEGSHSVNVTYADVYDWELAESVATSKSGGTVKGEAVTTPEEPEEPEEPEQPVEPEEPVEPEKPAEPEEPSETEKPSESEKPSEPEESDEPEEPAEPEKDKNSKLKSLQVYPGNLKPAFDPKVTSYVVETTVDVTEVTITASTSSSKAKVNVSGGKDLKLGENAAKVVVTAENGNVTVYELNIICGEMETIDINGNIYTIDETFSDGAIPEGFARGEVNYHGRAYEAAVNENGTLAFVCLKGTEQSNFFMYDQETETFSEIMTLKVSEDKTVFLVPLDETVYSYELTSMTIDENEVDAWKLDDEFLLINTVAADGTKQLYCYDQIDGTYQRYVVFEEPAEEEEEPTTEIVPTVPEQKQTFLDMYYVYIIIGLGTVALILLIVVICLLATRKQTRVKGRARERRNARKQQKEEQ